MRLNPEYLLGIGPLQEMRLWEILRHCAEDLSGIETMFADFKYIKDCQITVRLLPNNVRSALKPVIYRLRSRTKIKKADDHENTNRI